MKNSSTILRKHITEGGGILDLLVYVSEGDKQSTFVQYVPQQTKDQLRYGTFTPRNRVLLKNAMVDKQEAVHLSP